MTTDLPDFPSFEKYFQSLHDGASPYPWQAKLQKTVADTGWPQTLPIPTGLGKTASIAVWLYELARETYFNLPRTAPMRLYYVVDRRVVIDQTHQYVQNILRCLEKPAMRPIQDAFRRLLPSGDDRLILASSIHGEDPDDTLWMRASGPVVVSLTSQQLVSRLLMRGYGVSEKTRSIHAGLIGIDRLILFDEPHLSRPALQTISDQERIQAKSKSLGIPSGSTVLLGATLPESVISDWSYQPSEPVFNENENLQDRRARRILKSSKKLKIHQISNTTDASLAKETEKLVKELVQAGTTRILAVFNTVGAARTVFLKLQKMAIKNSPDIPVRLLTSRFRSVDKATSGLDEGPVTLVSTQTIEVGVDLSFDALITEATSYDTLVQRLGRLNRRGDLQDSTAFLLSSRGKISATTGSIYGEDEVTATIKLLESQKNSSDEVDVSPESLNAIRESHNGKPLQKMPARTATFHTGLLPVITQTLPTPDPDVPVEAFISGPDAAVNRDVHVAWRNELLSLDVEPKKSKTTFSGEYVDVPLGQLSQFLTGEKVSSAESDLVDQTVTTSAKSQLSEDVGAQIRFKNPGDTSWSIPRSLREIRPGADVILKSTLGGYSRESGWTPANKTPATTAVRDALMEDFKRCLLNRNYHTFDNRWVAINQSFLSELDVDDPLHEATSNLLKVQSEHYQASQVGINPDSSNISAELVDSANNFIAALTNSQGKPVNRSIAAYSYEWGIFLQLSLKAQQSPNSNQNEDVFLEDHLLYTAEIAQSSAKKVGLNDDLVSAVSQAGALHDVGKATPEFQSFLGNTDSTLEPKRLLAKSSESTKDQSSTRAMRTNNSLRFSQGWDGLRHEVHSLRYSAPLGLVSLTNHLIASHHGRYRPGILPSISSIARNEPFNREIEIGVAHTDSFLKLNEEYGPWGLAYLEAVVRTADWSASAAPSNSTESRTFCKFKLRPLKEILKNRPADKTPDSPDPATGGYELPGLRVYPLASWYVALGLLAAAKELGEPDARIAWKNPTGLPDIPPLTPVLYTIYKIDDLVQAAHSSHLWQEAQQILHDFGCSPFSLKGQKISPATNFSEALRRAEQSGNWLLLGMLADSTAADNQQRIPLAIPAFANNSSFPNQAKEIIADKDQGVAETVLALKDLNEGYTVSKGDGGFERGEEFAPLVNGREGQDDRLIRSSLTGLSLYGMCALGTVPPSGLGVAHNRLILPLPEVPCTLAEMRALTLVGGKDSKKDWSSIEQQWVIVGERLFRSSSRTSSWKVTPSRRSELNFHHKNRK